MSMPPRAPQEYGRNARPASDSGRNPRTAQDYVRDLRSAQEYGRDPRDPRPMGARLPEDRPPRRAKRQPLIWILTGLLLAAGVLLVVVMNLPEDNALRVIECNLRASRSFPFVSKITKFNFIGMATEIMLGKEVEPYGKTFADIDYVGVKSSQFSFARLLKADPVLGVDMASTGEVACIGDNYHAALLKSMLSVGHRIPDKNKGVLISSGSAKSKVDLLDASRMLKEKGYKLYATGGTADFLAANGIESEVLHWPDTGKSPNVIDYLSNHKIDLVINIPKNNTAMELENGHKIRRTAIDFNIPLITNPRLASAFITAFCNMTIDDIQIKSWDEYK
jgi:carbamoyl-phosphate synthase large subunit